MLDKNIPVEQIFHSGFGENADMSQYFLPILTWIL